MILPRLPHRRRWLVAGLVVASMVVITIDLQGGGSTATMRSRVQDAFSPVQRAADRVFSPVGDWIDGVTRAGELKDENTRLREALAQSLVEQARVSEIEKENAELRAQLDLPGVDETIERVAAQITTFDASPYEDGVVLNKGTDAGIREGMPVLSSEGLIGRVAVVSSRTATVVLLHDPLFGVGVKLGDSDKAGILEGTGDPEKLRLVGIGSLVDVRQGEEVYTSGTDVSRFPPGILVGTVSGFSTAPGATTQDIEVLPVLELTRLKFVQVLLWPPDPDRVTAATGTPVNPETGPVGTGDAPTSVTLGAGGPAAPLAATTSTTPAAPTPTTLLDLTPARGTAVDPPLTRPPGAEDVNPDDAP